MTLLRVSTKLPCRMSHHLAMSEVPPSGDLLRCWICFRTFTAYRNLVCHRVRKHRTLLARPNATGAAARTGATGRRRGVASNGVPVTGVHDAGGGVGGHGSDAVEGRCPAADASGGPDASGSGVHTTADAGRGAEIGYHSGSGMSHGGNPVAGAGADGGCAAEAASRPVNITYKETVIEDALEAMESMVRLTRRPVPPPPRRKRKVGGHNDSSAEEDASRPPQEYKYSTVAAEVRSFYEDKRDWSRAEPLLKKRKTCAPGRFNSVRLRALQTFALTGRPGGFSLSEQEGLYDLLDVWDRTKPGMVVDAGHNKTLRDSMRTVNAFKDALRDDVDDAVLEEGWRKCKLEEGGIVYEAYFRSVLEVALKMLRDGQGVKLWSGGDRPAPPTSSRESPLDGDAFRLCESIIMAEHGADSFVLAFHVFSDASQLAWSGGKLMGEPHVVVVTS